MVICSSAGFSYSVLIWPRFAVYKNCFLVTGAFFSPSGIQHSNYTEILLPDIIAEAWATLSKVKCKKREVKWVRGTLTDYTEVILPDIIAEA